MTDSEQRGSVPVGVGFTRVFYRHAMRSVALALVVFSVVGSTAAMTLHVSGADPVLLVVAFFAWGMIGAAIALATRTPPF